MEYESLYDPNSAEQKELAEIEKFMRKNKLSGYFETESSSLWGYIPDKKVKRK